MAKRKKLSTADDVKEVMSAIKGKSFDVTDVTKKRTT